jgi:hypothetical protein
MVVDDFCNLGHCKLCTVNFFVHLFLVTLVGAITLSVVVVLVDGFLGFAGMGDPHCLFIYEQYI